MAAVKNIYQGQYESIIAQREFHILETERLNLQLIALKREAKKEGIELVDQTA